MRKTAMRLFPPADQTAPTAPVAGRHLRTQHACWTIVPAVRLLTDLVD